MTSKTETIKSLQDGRKTFVAVKLLTGDPEQPRKQFDRAALNDLAADIAANGVLQPLTVRIAAKQLVVEMGERRLRAARIAKLSSVPCLLSDDEATRADGDGDLARAFHQLAENHHREPLNAIDLARFLRKMRDEFDMSATDIAAQLKARGFRNMGRSYVTNTMRLLDLPAEYQQQIADGTMPAGHGKYILQLGNDAALLEQFKVEFSEWQAEAEREERPVVSADVRFAVRDALGELGVALHTYSSDIAAELAAEGFDKHLAARPQFDFETVCKGCESFKSITNDGDKTFYCLNREAFLGKQRDALNAINTAADGEAADERNVDPFADTDLKATITPEQRESALRDKVGAHLLTWLRGRLRERFARDIPATTQFIFWAAAGCAHGTVYPWATETASTQLGSLGNKLDDESIEPARLMGLDDPLLIERGQEFDSALLVDALILRASFNHVWRWALTLDIDLDGYRITEGYFACLDKRELSIMGEGLGLDTPFSAKRPALIATITDGAPTDHVPQRVRDVFNDIAKKHVDAVHRYDQAKAGNAAQTDLVDEAST